MIDQNSTELKREFYDNLYADEEYASDHYAHETRLLLSEFVAKLELEQARTLDIGCGRGLYQDVVADWTGVDISNQAAHYIHPGKQFRVASAEKLPFADDSFDLVWSINFLEHSPTPERALAEMVRVLKPGGFLYLWPAWRVPPWRPHGYEVTGYSELSWTAKAMKLAVPWLNVIWTRTHFRVPVRLLREITYTATHRRPTNLQYTAFTPNYAEFLLPDSDACASLDAHAVLLWLQSRGFAPVEPMNLSGRILLPSGPLVVRLSDIV
jgi:SAM-dependent methyltransferase